MAITAMATQIKDLTNGTVYLAQVRAVDSAGAIGEWSEPGSGTPKAMEEAEGEEPMPTPALPVFTALSRSVRGCWRLAGRVRAVPGQLRGGQRRHPHPLKASSRLSWPTSSPCRGTAQATRRGRPRESIAGLLFMAGIAAQRGESALRWADVVDGTARRRRHARYRAPQQNQPGRRGSGEVRGALCGPRWTQKAHRMDVWTIAAKSKRGLHASSSVPGSHMARFRGAVQDFAI